jgi:hypothetical protein
LVSASATGITATIGFRSEALQGRKFGAGSAYARGDRVERDRGCRSRTRGRNGFRSSSNRPSSNANWIHRRRDCDRLLLDRRGKWTPSSHRAARLERSNHKPVRRQFRGTQLHETTRRNLDRRSKWTPGSHRAARLDRSNHKPVRRQFRWTQLRSRPVSAAAWGIVCARSARPAIRLRHRPRPRPPGSRRRSVAKVRPC